MIQFYLVVSLLCIMHTQEIRYSFTITKKTFNSISSLFNNSLIGNICLGEPKRCFKLRFSLKTHFIWLCKSDTKSNYYDPQMSQTYFNVSKRQIFDTQKNSANGYKSNETFYILNTSEPRQIRFILVSEKYCEETEIEGEIGLNTLDLFHGYIKGQSFHEQLAIQNITYPNAIGIKYSNDNEGLITFGVNNDLLTNEGAYKLYTTPLSSRHLMYQLNSFIYNNTKYSAAVFVVICLDIKPIILPLFVYQTLRDNIFPSLLLNDFCYEVLDDSQYFYFFCKKDVDTSHFLPFDLTFNDQTTIQIEIDDLFIEYGDKDELLFGLIGSKSVNNQIQLGEMLLKKYYIISERTNHSLTFVPNEIYDLLIKKEEVIMDNKSNAIKMMIRFIQIAFVLLALFSIYLLFILYRNKRRNDNDSYNVLYTSNNKY